jgi:hypothetical protein
MTDLDFRYKMPDGTTVEAFQMTEATRYQEGLWPEWMNSKMLLTTEGSGNRKKHYLNINDVETEIPEYGWVVNDAGKIKAVPYEVMELAEKVVRVVPKIPPVAEPQSDKALRLAAKITSRSFEDVVAEDQAQVEEANRNRQALIDTMHPEDAAAQGFTQTGTPPPEDGPPDEEVTGQSRNTPPRLAAVEAVPAPDATLLHEIRMVYKHWDQGDWELAKSELQAALAMRTNWCNCAPGLCDGNKDDWECRQKSLLAK